MNDDIGIVILAAGGSTRMGFSKQLLQIDGEYLLIRTVNAALSSGIKNITVVLGSNEAVHRKIIQALPVVIINNPNWLRGMGSSLKAGLNEIRKKDAIESIIVLVCDQPMLTGNVLKKMIGTYRSSGKGIVASRYGDTIGVPVLFSSDYFDVIEKLNDDQGAKKIIYENIDGVAQIPFEGGLIDLDTPDDLTRFQNLGASLL